MNNVLRTRRDFLALLAGTAAGAALLATGCGGGGSGDGDGGGNRSPTEATRVRVQSLHDMAVRGSLLAGFQTPALAAARNGWIPGGSLPIPMQDGAAAAAEDSGGTTGGGGGGSLPPHGSMAATPMLGAFLRKIAAAPPVTRAARIRQQKDGGDGNVSSPGGGDGIARPDDIDDDDYDFGPTVYFDYYLGLWVRIEEQPDRVTYFLFQDEALTLSAGKIETTQPTDYETYPLVWRSEYAFLDGYLAGARGRSESVTNADGSGSQSYENVYPEGGSDRGESFWTARGDYTWTARTELTGGVWTQGSGSFRSDGSGGTRWETSEGYKGDYTYQSDGSGRARLTGPDPGLPVTIVWDAYGNTTITYADGTTERIPGWGIWYGGGGGGTTGGGGYEDDTPPPPVTTEPAKG